METGKFLQVLMASGPGKAGLTLLTILVMISLYVVFTYPRDFGTARWANPVLWADNPKAAPPVWTNLFTRKRRAEHRILKASNPTRVESVGTSWVHLYELPFSYQADEPPTFISLSLSEIVYHSRPPVVSASLVRPDGNVVLLYRQVLRGPRPGESPPYRRHVDTPLRVLLSGEERAFSAMSELLESTYGVFLPREKLRGRLETALFGTFVSEDEFEVLPGDYRVNVQFVLHDPEDYAGMARVVVGGSVYGLMGTDALGRDLREGLLFGLPVALLIGVAASTISTLIGTLLGLVSGYRGGHLDMAIQRAADIVSNIPMLPLLIFIVLIGGQHLWLIILVLVAFSWPGLTIIVRSLVLQIRSGQGVEAAEALGASRRRVIFRHIFPHTASYVFAQLVFFAPSAILAEAGLSFLGLGDPSIPTWGQILEHGFRTGAVFLGYWWWVVPPGLLIVLTALTFMLISLSLEPVVDPRLRRTRIWRY
ncbi:ABC transporter permease [Candidatus Aerophobetes bacterium]|nr:ABC transporter permease [Candidatus Aerophobetes bacterium]